MICNKTIKDAEEFETCNYEEIRRGLYMYMVHMCVHLMYFYMENPKESNPVFTGHPGSHLRRLRDTLVSLTQVSSFSYANLR